MTNIRKIVGENASPDGNPISFENQIENYVFGRMKSGSELYVMSNSRDLHLDNDLVEKLPIVMKQSVLRKTQGKHSDDGLTFDDLSKIPNWIKSTPLVLDSLTVSNSVVVIVDDPALTRDLDTHVILAIHLDIEKNKVSINEISSIYRRSDIEYMVKNVYELNKNLYVNKKTSDWILNNGVQFPEQIANHLRNNCITFEKINKEFILKHQESSFVKKRLSPVELAQRATEKAQQVQGSQDHTYNKKHIR